ncbi:anti-sigma factor [Corynebacterium accolens]|uniref:Anti-sigma factor n=1 Tax=Corynebacterium accolens TaxID=38284 RepID=A0AAP4FCM7_9CORY|nr:anti-sigma factor [Corynebacterium accolens]MDK4310843.1 anti-sigma factor [Corynebacterium accolens]MDK4335512.1 anti-sigma factor [Corynebacterium accolens]MDK8504409.1 anti-sigma factor [Corynebacterium accolens]MDK8660668.1 anti-sigma factor [Corynebacterium accolens]
MSNTHEFSEAEFDDFLDSLPEIDPPPEMKDKVFSSLDAEAEVVEMPRRRWRAFVAVPAAAAVVIAGVVLWIPHQGGEDAGEGNTVVAESSGEESMHHIMEADDLIQGKADASGARLDIVSSASMGKSGAMVDGQPELKEGMGAQVWAISEDKTMTSAGVIGQDPHDGVWMPFESNAVKVMVTEEPAAGSAEPTGRTLVEVRLS